MQATFFGTEYIPGNKYNRPFPLDFVPSSQDTSVVMEYRAPFKGLGSIFAHFMVGLFLIYLQLLFTY